MIKFAALSSLALFASLTATADGGISFPAVPALSVQLPTATRTQLTSGAQSAGQGYCSWVQSLKTIAPSQPKAREYYQAEAKLFEMACVLPAGSSLMTAPTFVGLPKLPAREKGLVERLIFAPRDQKVLGYARDAGLLSYMDYQEAHSMWVQMNDVFAPEVVLRDVKLPDGYLGAWSDFADHLAAYYLR